MPLDTDLLLESEGIAHYSSPIALRRAIVEHQGKPFRARDHQQTISDAIRAALLREGKRFVAVSIAQQQGKALALDTPIATPEGWATMGDLRVGDEVFDETGKPTQVVATTQVFYDHSCYVVKFDDRDSIVADKDHLWRVALDRGSRSHITTLHNSKSLAKKRYSHPRLNNALPLQLPELNLPIDPYVLGIWLGDGHSAMGYITQGHQDAPEVLGYITEAGYVVRRKTENTYLVEGLWPDLRAMGLLRNKHIPLMYLRASEEQRWALLNGLIDSDGYVDPRGTVEFVTTKEQLAEDAEELLHSLGIKVMTLKGRAKLYGRDIGPKWRLYFYHPRAARLERKRKYCREPVRQKHRYVWAEETASVPVRCIQVASPSGMFLAGRGMIPTHNSTITSLGGPEYVLELHSLGILPGGVCALMSFEDALPMSWSRTIRRDIEACSDILVSRTRTDSRAASEWETTEGGGIIAVGTAGSVQGRPITYLGIDDPTKNMEQAMSPAHQEKLWYLWNSILFGRLQPWSVVLVTMARMAPDDFIGRLKSRDYEGDPDDWEFIEIPYLAKEDDVLGRPVGQPLQRPQADQTVEQAYEEAAQIQKTISPYIFQCMYQQDPRDPEGSIFPPTKWRYWGGEFPKASTDERYELPPAHAFEQVLFSLDAAFKDLKTSDWVVCGLWGRIGADYYLVDLIRGRWSFTDTCVRIKNFTTTYRIHYPFATTIVVEDKANGPAIIDSLRSHVGGLVEFNPGDYGSKLARAWAIQPYQLGGNLYIPAESERPWVAKYRQEMADFRGTGGNETDDQVDMTSMAILYMQKYQFSPAVIASPADLDDNLFHSRFTQPRRAGIL